MRQASAKAEEKAGWGREVRCGGAKGGKRAPEGKRASAVRSPVVVEKEGTGHESDRKEPTATHNTHIASTRGAPWH